MARIHPAGWREVEALGAAQREIETLHLLAEALPDAYSVFHGVHWTRLERGASVFGDIDFVIVAPSGRTLLIEQKAGFLTETPEGLMKAHGRTAKNVAVLLARNADAVRVRFAATHQGEALPLETLLYCPDHHVRNPAAVGIEPERIVHAGSREPLSKVIRRALPLDEPASPLAARVGRFFADVLELVPDIGAVTDKVDGLYTRLSGGLAEWGRRIEADPFRLHVIGTAGSGKTQLALAAFRDAVAAGRRPLYVCYNRPLADHMAGQVPPGGEVATYHQLCERTARMLGQRPDFSRPDAFRQLEAIFADSVPGPDALFDELLVDEGQDFDIAWRDPLLRRLREGGRAWWFEDPMQNLYSRPPVPLPGWVRLRADTNFRSPTQVVALLGQLLGDVTTIHGASPVEGEVVTHNVYSTQAQLIEQTKSAITHAVGQGFKRSAIVVLT
ncbi:MAG: nuclease, partial [Burkholderiales bacterium]|nr:nuclease [Burkholderiales bacterium]